MSNPFFDRPILNSPYERPTKHWELDKDGQPTQKILNHRREASYITPIPKARKQRGASQKSLDLDDDAGLSTAEQEYDPRPLLNRLRHKIDGWRQLPNPNQWGVTPETARLLQYWRDGRNFGALRPFFCQVEAVETLIWLTEVAPQHKADRDEFLAPLSQINGQANPGLERIALKLATGAGKTTVMAMIIAWQTINAVRQPKNKKFTRGFLVVTPGITIKDRLRVLQPNDPESYYAHPQRELVPPDLRDELGLARIVVTNFHQLGLREKIELSKGTRSMLRGRGPELLTEENEGQMIQRVMPDLASMKNIMVLNDEAHHCYREKPGERSPHDEELKGDDRKEAQKNTEAARQWITGLEMVQRKLGLNRIVDLSATPFFLSGSGYAEGTLFGWTMSDFSLMDAIECGIVKLPRVPVADNIPGADVPMYRDLWKHIGAKMPKAGRAKAGELDPQKLPPQLQTALEALYGHYKKQFKLWEECGAKVPPCFIVVCNNTSTSKLVHDFIAGYRHVNADGTEAYVAGKLDLFRNFDTNGNLLPRRRTFLIDSRELESGEGLDDAFRTMAADEIAQFRTEILDRGGQAAHDLRQGKDIDDATLLREVMNTVGKEGKLGASIRCVVSVSMLTEGWDANTVTHVLGVRAFGTQLLCEQVIGRALRRRSYELNSENLFDVEYADVLGIPFDFTAKPVVAPPTPPRETIHVHAVNPERAALEIRFPNVIGYRVELPRERLRAAFDDDSTLTVTPDLIGATHTEQSGIIGERADLSLAHTQYTRDSQAVYELTSYVLLTKFRDGDGNPKNHLFGDIKKITREWIENHLECKGDTYTSVLGYKAIKEMACEKIFVAINRAALKEDPTSTITVELDPYNATGSTRRVSFNTSNTDRWQTDARKCHVNYVILDSDWEAEFCRVVEAHPRVRSYVKNHSLGFRVPYRMGAEAREYRPDFIVRVEDGQGEEDLLNLIVEIKGFRGEDAKFKKSTMDTYWVPGVNRLGAFGRWAFAEFRDVYQIESDFKAKVEAEFTKMIDAQMNTPRAKGA